MKHMKGPNIHFQGRYEKGHLHLCGRAFHLLMEQGRDNETYKWTKIFTHTASCMDFIMGLPKLGSKLITMVVVNHLFKFSCFCFLKYPLNSFMVAQVLKYNIFKLHGMFQFNEMDYDHTIASNFWQKMLQL